MPHVSGGSARVDVEGFSYSHPGRATPVFHDLELHIPDGQHVLLLGPSGGGKSTLLMALAGVLNDEEAERRGSVSIGGLPPEAARGRVGLMQQDPETQVILPRIGDDVAFGAENVMVPPEEIEPRVRQALRKVGLNFDLARPTANLSGGQKQRLALAGIMAMRPGLLLLDEPTANIDPAGAEDLVAAVADTVNEQGSTLIVVEHRIAQWLPIIDRVIVLNRHGGIEADGTPDQVLSEKSDSLQEQGVWVPGWRPRSARAMQRTAGSNLLEAQRLTVGRGGKEIPGEHTLTLSEGHVVAISGANGAGKSTLGLTLGGLLKPLGGTLRATKQLASEGTREPISWKPKRLIERIGSVFQEPEHQFVTNSVEDELAFGLRGNAQFTSSHSVRSRVDELLERLNLQGLAEANPFTLSGGQKRRLSVGTVMALKPQLLILDEPTFGQDTRTWQALVDLLSEAAEEGCAIVAITHEEIFAQAMCADRYALATPA